MSKITFVCCIEAGSLEELTVRMISSLRRWGGKHKNADVIAVKPRFGSPLSSKTLTFMKENAVNFVASNVNTESWFKYMNKPHALKLADKYIHTDYVCWIDSDTIILKEPFSTVDFSKYDVSACVSDKNIGSSGNGDRFEPYWDSLCNVLGLQVNDMPWVVTKDNEQDKIRLYFNSGVFLYKKNTVFAVKYLEVCQKLLLSKIANSESGVFFTDQVALGLTVCLMKLSFAELPLADNFPINSNKVRKNHDMSGEAAIFHHHDMMWPENWDVFLQNIEGREGDVLTWLVNLGPMANNSCIPCKVVSSILSNMRELRLRLFLKGCDVVC